MGIYASYGIINAGGTASVAFDMTNQVSSFGWNVGVGIGFGNDAYGIGLNIGYGSDGFSYGIGGYYNSKAWQSNPVYEPDKWNDNGAIQYTNNCYSYALDDPNNGNYGGLQPGNAGGQPLTDISDITLDKVLDAAISDGWVKKPNFWNKLGFGKRGYYEVYLVTDDGVDYHWYRQDKGGLWSQKHGVTTVTNIDGSNHLIYNPANANQNYGHGLNYNSGGILLWAKKR